MDNKQILDAIKEMNVLDLAELVKEIEETFRRKRCRSGCCCRCSGCW